MRQVIDFIELKDMVGVEKGNCISCQHLHSSDTHSVCKLGISKSNLKTFPFKKEQPACWSPCFWHCSKFVKMLKPNCKPYNMAVYKIFDEITYGRTSYTNMGLAANICYWFLKTFKFKR